MRESIIRHSKLSSATMLPIIRLYISPLSLVRVKYSDREQRVALLVQLTSRQWTSFHLDLLRPALDSDRGMKADLDDLTHFYYVFHAVSSSDTLATFGKSLIVFPDLEGVSQQFIRVMNSFASIEETVSPLTSAINMPLMPS